jgi:zinc protease
MFKSTRRMAAETFDRLTEDVGGQNNAFTSEDVTAYQSEVPANHLQRLLWAEAERMSNLNVDQLNFDSERRVVQEEYRESVLASPYGRLWHALPKLHYRRHPYRRPTIGSIEDLGRARLSDLRHFHDRFYRPDNAVLVVAGDFDEAEMQAGVDRTFGTLPLPQLAGSVPRRAVQEVPRRNAERVTLRAPRVPLPAVAVLWSGPPVTHADAPALRVAAALLSAGESSRLNEALVYRQRVAQQAGFEHWLSAEAGMLIGFGIAAAGMPLARVERALLAEVDRLARREIDPDELERVRALLLTAALVKRQTPAGVAGSLGEAVLLHGDPGRAERELPELQAVQVADVQQVLRRYVLGGRSVTVQYVSGAAST